LKSLDIQLYLFYWIHGKPELYDNGSTEYATENMAVASKVDGESVRGERLHHKWSTVEDSLVGWLDIDKVVEANYSVELHEYLVEHIEKPLSHWGDLPGAIEAKLGEGLATL